MKSEMHLGDSIGYTIDRTRQLVQSLEFGGFFHVELYRDGKLIENVVTHNAVTDNAKLQFLNTFFYPSLSIPNTAGWPMGIIDANSFSNTSGTDTVSVHNGWTEFVDYYHSADPTNFMFRNAWVPGPAYTGKSSNSAAAEFDFTATGNIQGIFILGGGSIIGNLGMKGDWSIDGYGLLSTCLFPAVISVQNLDVLKIFYTIQI